MKTNKLANRFVKKWKSEPVKSMLDPLPAPPRVCVRVWRPWSIGGAGWLSACGSINDSNTPFYFDNPAAAVAKLAEFRGFLGGEIEFKS